MTLCHILLIMEGLGKYIFPSIASFRDARESYWRSTCAKFCWLNHMLVKKKQTKKKNKNKNKKTKGKKHINTYVSELAELKRRNLDWICGIKGTPPVVL